MPLFSWQMVAADLHYIVEAGEGDRTWYNHE
jgi:hypothetical protein